MCWPRSSPTLCSPASRRVPCGVAGDTVVHGDVRFANILVTAAPIEVRLVDWETSGRGDHRWDLAGVLQEYLSRDTSADGRPVSDRDPSAADACRSAHAEAWGTADAWPQLAPFVAARVVMRAFQVAAWSQRHGAEPGASPTATSRSPGASSPAGRPGEEREPARERHLVRAIRTSPTSPRLLCGLSADEAIGRHGAASTAGTSTRPGVPEPDGILTAADVNRPAALRRRPRRVRRGSKAGGGPARCPPSAGSSPSVTRRRVCSTAATTSCPAGAGSSPAQAIR